MLCLKRIIKSGPSLSTFGISPPINFIRCSVPVRKLYVQGQSPEPNIREYFYYIDHQGMLFMDDARIKNFTSCFKDKPFLAFFFKRLQINKTGRFEDNFPYISPCGRERNYVRCDDVPIVYTHVVPNSGIENQYRLLYGYGNETMSVLFEPEKLIMLPNTGRVYHPAPDIVGGIGLVRSALAIEFSKYFQFDNGDQNAPTHFTWNNVTHQLIKCQRAVCKYEMLLSEDRLAYGAHTFIKKLKNSQGLSEV